MDNLKLKDNRLVTLSSLVACVISLVVSAASAEGQVVLVSEKLRTTRSTGKAKVKPKAKTYATPTPLAKTEVNPAPLARTEVNPAPASTPQPNSSRTPLTKILNFAIVAPSLLKKAETPNAAPGQAASKPAIPAESASNTTAPNVAASNPSTTAEAASNTPPPNVTAPNQATPAEVASSKVTPTEAAPRPATLSEVASSVAARNVAAPKPSTPSEAASSVTAPNATAPKPDTPSEPASNQTAAKAASPNTIAPKAVAPSRLFSYGFEVITGDARGKVIGRRAEQARYMTEGLNGGVLLDMVEVPGGMFLMGIPQEEVDQVKKEQVRGTDKELRERLLERVPWEAPQHKVALPGFFMSKHEITQAQWRAVASLPKVKRDLMSDPSEFKGGELPVDSVSWEDAVEFCERLSRATGRRYRLPTEAEWEYACRAGSSTSFHFGDTVTPAWANYRGKHPYALGPKGENREQTVTVGSLGMPNAFGLYDMHGNVWEWCLDSWHTNYISSPADGRSWEEDGISYLKVLRGGAWDSPAGECRASSRNRLTSSLRLNNAGFRVVTEAVSDVKVAQLSQ